MANAAPIQSPPLPPTVAKAIAAGKKAKKLPPVASRVLASPSLKAAPPETQVTVGSKHPMICPFSGKPMEIRCVGADALFMVVSPHGYSSKIMKSREECLSWASMRDGVASGYVPPTIDVKPLEAPDNSASEAMDIAPNPDSVGDEELPESLR